MSNEIKLNPPLSGHSIDLNFIRKQGIHEVTIVDENGQVIDQNDLEDSTRKRIIQIIEKHQNK